jgi:hypothetical protein
MNMQQHRKKVNKPETISMWKRGVFFVHGSNVAQDISFRDGALGFSPHLCSNTLDLDE